MTLDAGWKDSFIFFCMSAGVFAFAISTTATVIFCIAAKEEPAIAAELAHMGGIPVYFMIYFGACLLSSLLSSQVISAATTIVLHFFGGKGTFQRTFTVLSCCWVVLLFSWIPLIGLLGALYFFYLAYLGLARAHEVPGWKGILSLFIATGTLSFLAFCVISISVISAFTNMMKNNDPYGDVHDPAMRRLMQQYEQREQREE